MLENLVPGRQSHPAGQEHSTLRGFAELSITRAACVMDTVAAITWDLLHNAGCVTHDCTTAGFSKPSMSHALTTPAGDTVSSMVQQQSTHGVPLYVQPRCSSCCDVTAATKHSQKTTAARQPNRPKDSRVPSLWEKVALIRYNLRWRAPLPLAA